QLAVVGEAQHPAVPRHLGLERVELLAQPTTLRLQLGLLELALGQDPRTLGVGPRERRLPRLQLEPRPYLDRALVLQLHRGQEPLAVQRLGALALLRRESGGLAQERQARLVLVRLGLQRPEP